MKVLVATEKPFAKKAVDGIRAIVEQAGMKLSLLEKYTRKEELLEAVADAVEGDGGPIPSADDVPMYAASSARPPYGQSQTAGKPCQPGGSAKNVQNAKDVKSAKNIQKQSTSAPTVVFGLLGVIIGVIALVFGCISPDRMISLFSPNPQLLTAIICAVVGLILVIVAVVWAIVGAVKKRK